MSDVHNWAKKIVDERRRVAEEKEAARCQLEMERKRRAEAFGETDPGYGIYQDKHRVNLTPQDHILLQHISVCIANGTDFSYIYDSLSEVAKVVADKWTRR